MSELRTRWHGLAGPLGIAVGVHLVMALTTFITAAHTGGDNAAYLTLGSSLVEEGRYLELWHPGTPPHTKYPPGFPLVLAVWTLLGFRTFLAFKVVPLLFTGAATACCYLWLRRVHTVRFATTVATLFGASTAVLFASRWILSDPMFLALTLAALWLITPRGGSRAAVEADEERLVSSRRVWAGVLLVILAYFTRSAGLPLVLAVAMWLGQRRRFRPLAIYGALFAVPALLWWLRDARTGHDYISEFWMVNPYAPELGRIGLGGLLGRVGSNLWQYSSQYIPTGITGVGGQGAAVLGVVLGGLALYGWARRMRRGAGVAEWFALLYSGLILVWPAVWSGDRFALPLFPLVLFYAGEALAVLTDTFRPGAERWTLGAAAAVLALLMGATWYSDVGPAAECRARVRAEGPWSCYGQNVRDFAAMALWAGEHLDEDDMVLTRKPRIFYLLSGRRSVTYPFSTDRRTLLAQADSLDVGYVVRDTWDRATRAYVDPVLAGAPARFCRVASVGSGSAPPTHLLALRAAPPASLDPEGAEPTIGECPHPAALEPPNPDLARSGVIPILDPGRRVAPVR